MLNFRKLRQDFSPQIVKEGKDLFDKKRVLDAKLLHVDHKSLRLSGKILSQFDNSYESELEIDRIECEVIDSNCDCPHTYDCQHLAALLYYLEEHFDKILVAFSQETNVNEIGDDSDIKHEQKEALLQKFEEAKTKEVIRREEEFQRQLLAEYVSASQVLATSPFFSAAEKVESDPAEFSLIFNAGSGGFEIQVALRLPYRSKPLYIPKLALFFEALRFQEPLFIGSRRFTFSLTSFPQEQQGILSMVMEQVRFPETPATDRAQRIGYLSADALGMVLATVFERVVPHATGSEEEMPILPGVFEGSLETPLRFSPQPAAIRCFLEHLPPPTSKILLTPKLRLGEAVVETKEVRLFECAKPGMVFKGTYFRFPSHITRLHLHNLASVRDLTIPEPLFGSFVENALPVLSRYAELAGREVIDEVATVPFKGELKARCDLSFLNGELEAELFFIYPACEVPAAEIRLNFDQIGAFVTPQGVVARRLVEERRILDELFQDFIYNPQTGTYTAKSEKRVVEFMTDVIPRYKGKITFNCPQNLLDQFIYDKTTFKLHLQPGARIDSYEIELKVEGALKGVMLDALWECLASRRAFLEDAKGRKKGEGKMPKILVLDLDRLAGVIQLFDEMGITLLDDHKLERPLFTLSNIDAASFKGLPVKITISEQLLEIRKQMLGEAQADFSPVPKEIAADLRPYQKEGIKWLERLRLMYLSGILADDMGLGKTLQAIVAISQLQKKKENFRALIVCPTSLLYNWKEEFSKFNPKIKVVVVDGIPQQRRKMIESHEKCDVLITSYTLVQKDIDWYKAIPFTYAILDEAQHIKNRGTRNARSVKMIQADHRLILSGTPIENSLDELWSLFDFLMPGFLGTYDRFIEKYVRVPTENQSTRLEYLKKKVAPFILRRMKADVLDDLPPVSEIVYHCQLSEVQQELYRSYAASARDELTKLVERDGFDRVQIHVLATLTRLKQICCHPAIFAKDTAEEGDSAKYELLKDLLDNLIQNRRKTVIFSQYTRMLQIIAKDFEERGIRFAYLDGASKNRLDIVNEFNNDLEIPVFLVSLKAGGTGLNLVGADTVIHYDMWWNPAVENQATDRVHRIGQKRSVSAYKLITLGTIEEKIAELQRRKKGLVKKVVSCDDEAISKLTWEEVLELLKT